MRRVPLLITAAAALAMCGGCASQGGAMQAKPSSYRATLDTDVIAAVETQAAHAGVDVYWIHPPRKPKDKDQKP